MIFLTPEQHKFLVKLSKSESISYYLILKDLEIAKFLVENNLAKFKKENLTRINPDTTKLERYEGRILSISITESGKSYLVALQHEKRKVRKETIFSVSALLISLAALLISIVSLSTTAPDVWQSIQQLLTFH